MNRSGPEDFRCPACRGELKSAGGLACLRCSKTYPVTDGVIDFRVEDRGYYFNPVPRDEMRALTCDMERQGWARTVERFLRYVREPLDWIDNLTVDGRYAWKLLLDLRPDGTLLDIGCGLGNLTYNVAPHVGKVYAMDLTLERAAFARRRFEMAGDRNHVVVLAGGDGQHLPFPDGSLDSVVLSGVLEWIGEAGVSGLDEGGKLARVYRMLRSSFGQRSPRAVQLRFIREVRRVLRPTGQLFVAIENRTGYRYFLGDPDHHSGLRYSSLLPRVLANVYSVWSARRPYRTYTYSIPGHRRLLHEAGFPGVEFFGLLPGYSHLSEIIPLESQGDEWKPVPPTRLRERLARSKYLVPALGIIAGNRQRQRRLLDEVVDAVETNLKDSLGEGRVQAQDYRVTGKNKALLTATYAGFPILIKLPLGSAARAGEVVNAEFLAFAKAGFGSGLTYVPASRGSGVVRGVHFYVEDRCKGVPLSQAIGQRGRRALLAQVEAVLEDLNPGPARGGEAFHVEIYRARVAQDLEAVSGLLPDTGLRAALGAFSSDRLRGLKCRAGIEHGDFGYDNILVEGNRITGLVDWEAGRAQGIPLLDVLSYLEGVERICGGGRQSLRETIPLLAEGRWPDREEWAFLERQYQRFGVDTTQHRVLVYLYWLHHVSSQVPYGLGYHRSRVERDVVGVARQLLAIA